MNCRGWRGQSGGAGQHNRPCLAALQGVTGLRCSPEARPPPMIPLGGQVTSGSVCAWQVLVLDLTSNGHQQGGEWSTTPEGLIMQGAAHPSLQAGSSRRAQGSDTTRKTPSARAHSRAGVQRQRTSSLPSRARGYRLFVWFPS